MKDQSFDTNYIAEEENKINLKKEISYYLFFWPWFAGAIIICCAVAFVHLRYTDRVYSTSAQIVIEQASDPSSFLTGGADVFGFQKVNMSNDIALMNSHHILSKVVDRLDLQTRVFTKGRMKEVLQYNKTCPFEVKFPEDKPQSWEINVTNGVVVVSKDSLSYSFSKGQELNNEDILIKGKDSLFTRDQSFTIHRVPLNTAVGILQGSLTAAVASKKGHVVNLSMIGTNSGRSEAIVNTLIEVLSEDQVADKREISEVSIAFIDERLAGLSKSIDTISENTISYQMSNEIFDPETQTGNALENIIKSQKEAQILGIQLEIANGLKNELKAQSNFDILPANVGIENESVNKLVNSYNQMVIERNSLLMSANDNSPVVLQLSNQLKKSREAIVTGVNRYITSLEVSLKSFQFIESQTRSIVAGLPNKGNVLRGYARDFKISEELYVFLLKRKEEASISYISAMPKLKVLSPAISGGAPIAPNPKVVYIAALFFALVVPFGILYILKLLDTKINTREDLEKELRGVGILGEVPFDSDIKKDNDQRGVTAESTRVVRSSLSFYLKKQGSTIINVTSTTKGEGKSFVSYNIASSYRALGKKVIMIGGDLRNPQLHNRIGIKRPPIGLSTFLNDETFNDIDTLITKGKEKREMDYLLSGSIPPNPAELLANPRMAELLEILKERYEIIVIDSAPLLLVSDSNPLLPLSDVIVYVVRAQYSDKNILPFIKEVINRPTTPSLGLVLNGLITGNGNSYNYKYRHSYGYKYNYGYGYGYGESPEGN